MSANPQVDEALEKLIAMKMELRAMLDQVEEMSPEDAPASRERIAEILREVEDVEEMANELDEREASGDA